MHNKKSYLKSHILGIVFAILFLLSTSHLAILSAAYNSVNVLGQTDGAGGADYVGGSINDGITANGYFGILNPGGTALDITGQRIFIADTNANRILVFNTDSNGVPQY